MRLIYVPCLISCGIVPVSLKRSRHPSLRAQDRLFGVQQPSTGLLLVEPKAGSAYQPVRSNKNAPAFGPEHLYLAERAGFEPALGYSPKHAFQACDLNRSSTSPKGLNYSIE